MRSCTVYTLCTFRPACDLRSIISFPLWLVSPVVLRRCLRGQSIIFLFYFQIICIVMSVLWEMHMQQVSLEVVQSAAGIRKVFNVCDATCGADWKDDHMCFSVKQDNSIRGSPSLVQPHVQTPQTQSPGPVVGGLTGRCFSFHSCLFVPLF